jgi:cytochrome c oxidase subunit III
MNQKSESVTNRNKIHPLKFALYLGFASILMLFAGLTSAYIVRQAAGNWLEFRLPNMFFYSTAVIILSSVTLHFSKRAFIKGDESNYRILLVVSFLLGLGFLICQYYGWQQLTDIGVDLKGNPAGSFVYALSGIHALHALGGITGMAVALLHAFTLKFKVTARRILRFEITIEYWHFMGFIWVYLFVFLFLQR